MLTLEFFLCLAKGLRDSRKLYLKTSNSQLLILLCFVFILGRFLRFANVKISVSEVAQITEIVIVHEMWYNMF